MNRRLLHCVISLFVAVVANGCVQNSQDDVIAPISASATIKPKPTVSLATTTATATEQPWPATFPPETYPTWEPSGLPPFLGNVWPPPNSKVRFEDYDPFIMFNGSPSWGKKWVGIGAQIIFNEILKNIEINENSKYDVDIDLYVNETKISNTMPTCIYMGMFLSHSDIEEFALEDIYSEENYYDWSLCNWDIKLSPNTYVVTIIAISPNGEVFEYVWQFTLLAPGEE